MDVVEDVQLLLDFLFLLDVFGFDEEGALFDLLSFIFERIFVLAFLDLVVVTLVVVLDELFFLDEYKRVLCKEL
jgi:hypothetical protein